MRVKLFFISLLILLLTGCASSFFTRLADHEVENEKIVQKKFAIAPIKKLDFQPPNSCGSPQTGFSGNEMEYKWTEEIKKNLMLNFPEQEFQFLKREDKLLKAKETSHYKMRQLAEENSVTQILNVVEQPAIEYRNMPQDNEMLDILSVYRDEYGCDYMVLFIEPSLKGTVVQTYTYNNGMPSSSSKTYYTAQVEIQLWDCVSGKMLYNSGAWDMASNSCIFVSPEEVAVQTNAKELGERLNDIVKSTIQTY